MVLQICHRLQLCLTVKSHVVSTSSMLNSIFAYRIAYSNSSLYNPSVELRRYRSFQIFFNHISRWTTQLTLEKNLSYCFKELCRLFSWNFWNDLQNRYLIFWWDYAESNSTVWPYPCTFMCKIPDWDAWTSTASFSCKSTVTLDHSWSRIW